MWIFRALALSTALVVAACAGGTTNAPAPENTLVPPATTAGPQTFAAVLQNVGENGPLDTAALRALAAAPYDAILIDEIGTSNSPYAATASTIVAQLHASAGSTLAHKRVYGYVDIGEAESFRSYWQNGWTPGSPSFILTNPDPNGFAGDYPVNFASPAWQALVFGSPTSLIDRAIADGFDGVYLDWVVGYTFAPVQAANPNAQNAMAIFVAAISAYAKAKQPGFTIVAQNAIELAGDTRYRGAVDAVLQEDLFFANSATQSGDIPQSPSVTAQLLSELGTLHALGKPIYAIDYATTTANAASAYTRARAAGIVDYVGSRSLASLTPFPPN